MDRTDEDRAVAADLARRAKRAHDSSAEMVVTPAEYRFIRNMESETWDEAVVSAWREQGNAPVMLESVKVRVQR